MQVLKDDMRTRILESASKNFAVYGFNQASMRKISSDAEMTVGNLYNYYLDKEALFDAVVILFKEDRENPRRAKELMAQKALEDTPSKMSTLLGMLSDGSLDGLL